MATNKDIFRITHNNLLPSQGNLLISEPFLQDLYFQRSVILLVEHTTSGSMGFVLNKKTDLIVNDFFSELEEYPNIPIYLGGPVSPNRLFFIHTLGDSIIPGAVKIADDLFFDGDFDSLKAYISKGGVIKGKVKFFLGYSGWSKGQLRQEIGADSWVVSDHNKVNVMNAEGELFWKDSLQQLGAKYKTWINYPKDPHLN